MIGRDQQVDSAAEVQDEANERSRAQATLPIQWHHVFEQLVDDYAVSSKIHTGEVVIEYDVLADLVRAGWRRVS